MAPKSPRTNSRRLSRAVWIGSASVRVDRFSGSLASNQNFARIEDAFRIQGMLDGVHDRELGRVGPLGQFHGFQPADAVLCADAPAESLDQIVPGRLQKH